MNRPKGNKPNDLPPESAGNPSDDASSEKTARDDSAGAEAASNSGTEKVRDLSLKEQLEAALAERDANRDSWLRTQAELENYRKRVQREADETRQYQAMNLSRDLIPVLDNLRRALAAAEKAPNVEELVRGVQMVERQFEDALGRHGVKPIEAIGKPFDPNLHQALQQLPSAEHPPMTVLNELERGYILKDRVVRPSSVIVSQAPPAASDESGGAG